MPAMTSPRRILAALAAAGVAAAIAFTPSSSSDAYDAAPGPHQPNIAARHADR